jgi:DNA-binding winged helix-turn-helix (wHTH) protein
MRLRFADCVLDLRARQLERQGKVVPLEPKVCDLLEALIQRRPVVVTNNELSLGSEALQVRRRSASALTVKVNHDGKADEKRSRMTGLPRWPYAAPQKRCRKRGW